jgi:hypothetical protein
MRLFLAAAMALLASACAHVEVLGRADFSRLYEAAQHAYSKEDFKGLEALHDDAVGKRLDDGTWLLEAFELAFDAQFVAGPAANYERTFLAWKERAPASRLRPILEAYLWERRARLAVGEGCDRLVVPGKPLATRMLERASRTLRDADADASPLYGSIAVRIAGAQGRSAEELDALLAAAAARTPGFLPTFWSRARFMLPPWSREFGEFDRFARERAPGREIGYALMYMRVARDICDDAFASSEVSWDRLRDGLQALAREHDTVWNWNLLGTFACRFRDRDTTREVLAKMGTKANLGIWTRGQDTKSCTLFVREAPPGRDVRT